MAQAPSASPFQPGDRVVTMSFGSYAERVAAVPEATFPLPEALSFEEGAEVSLNYLTVLAGLKRRGRRCGRERARQGAAGGTGTAAIQVAKALGARVFGVVSSEGRRRWRSTPGQRRHFGREMTGASR